jgi:transcriptional regulator with XRE-family HTH domain
MYDNVYQYQRIRRLREASGKTQQAMAEALGINISTYRAIERDKTEPRASTLANIANEFGVEVSIFFISTMVDTSDLFKSLEDTRMDVAEACVRIWRIKNDSKNR